MKVLISIAFFLLSTELSFSQIQKVELPKYISVGKFRMGFRTFSEMFYSVDDKNDTTFHWQYNNAEYETIDSYEYIHFASDGNAFEELYNILKDCFDKEVGYQTSFKLGEDLVIVKLQKSWGEKYLFISPPTGYFTLPKPILDKLFGKKK